MFRHLKSIYMRFRALHLEYSVPGMPLTTTAGRRLGNVDRVKISGQKVTFEGWCRANRISVITNGGGTTTTIPSLKRADVQIRHGGSPYVGFHLTEAIGNGRYTLVVEDFDLSLTNLHIQPVSALQKSWAVTRLNFQFLGALCRAFPLILRWKLSHDIAARTALKKWLGLEVETITHALDKTLLSHENMPNPRSSPKEPITIVLPVFNALELLPEVLNRVVENTDLPWHLVLIEDSSSDPKVRPWLREWVSVQSKRCPNQITLLENEQNLGFVRTVNRALKTALSRGYHVVLLNSDAFVPKDWASRLLAPILQDTRVASTTPMSNDAEIFSVPGICRCEAIGPDQADHLDAVAQKIALPSDLIETPTGVGFCMALNARFLKKLPELDVSFGRGYGEEVDWCQKVRAIGGYHVAVPNLFVEHRGGASFGDEAKRSLIARNNGIVAARYPKYDIEVQNFIRSDPLLTHRMMLAVAWAAGRAAEQAMPIYLAHSMGGGADMYLENRMRRDWEDKELPSIVLRVGTEMRWQVEVIFGEARSVGTLEDLTDLHRLMAPVKRRQIVYSCGVGDRNPIELPEALMSLNCNDQCWIEILVHDYFMVAPNYTLLDKNGRFVGPLIADGSSHQQDWALADWQHAWGKLIDKAQTICVFSESSRELFLATYPGARQKVQLRPHRLLLTEQAFQPALARSDGKRCVAFLGNIGFHKGAEVLCQTARLAANHKELTLMVLGDVDPAFDIPAHVLVHGSYDLENLPDLIQEYQITDWVIPSIWPETFSYTTHEALATGLRTYAFGLGAQGDAVARAQNGCVVPYAADGELAESLLNALLSPGQTEITPPFDKVVGL